MSALLCRRSYVGALLSALFCRVLFVEVIEDEKHVSIDFPLSTLICVNNLNLTVQPAVCA